MKWMSFGKSLVCVCVLLLLILRMRNKMSAREWASERKASYAHCLPSSFQSAKVSFKISKKILCNYLFKMQNPTWYIRARLNSCWEYIRRANTHTATKKKEMIRTERNKTEQNIGRKLWETVFKMLAPMTYANTKVYRCLHKSTQKWVCVRVCGR